MANILLLDDHDVAGRAMQGILARGNHACFIVTTPEEAWRFLRESVVVDLVFLDVKFGGGTGLSFLQRLRDDWFWKILPVVIYTAETESRLVKRALGLKVQNYLIKPFNDQSVYTEIAKALANPWRNLHFEEARSFAALMGLAPDSLSRMRREVMTGYDEAARVFPPWAEQRENETVFARLNALASDAEAAGIWAGVDFLRELQAQAHLGNWSAFYGAGEYLAFASRLIFCQLNPSYQPDCLRTPAGQDEAREAADRARWEGADVEAGGPVLQPEELEKQLASLSGCPVIDSAAAAFQMSADGRRASMADVMELAATDPGLCTQVLISANQVEHDDMTAIEDPRAAASILGELKLHALARSLPVACERHLQLPPLTWANFWMFQMGVGRVAEFICNYLDFTYLAPQAQTAGLLHDVGKLLLLKLQPIGLQTIVRYSREKKIPLHAAEQKYLGCTSRDLAVKFAESNGLPAVYVDVIRWVETPERAGAHHDLVAMVALARHVCLHNRVGCCGDTPRDVCPPIATTAAWRVLQPRLFPSFDLKRFESQAHAQCVALRHELAGRRKIEALVA